MWRGGRREAEGRSPATKKGAAGQARRCHPPPPTLVPRGGSHAHCLERVHGLGASLDRGKGNVSKKGEREAARGEARTSHLELIAIPS